jgi:hypothetical protein
VSRVIHLDIEPATAKTCGRVTAGGRWDHCPFVTTSSEPHRYRCAVFSTWVTLRTRGNQLLRWRECIEAEVKDG